MRVSREEGLSPARHYLSRPAISHTVSAAHARRSARARARAATMIRRALERERIEREVTGQMSRRLACNVISTMCFRTFLFFFFAFPPRQTLRSTTFGVCLRRFSQKKRLRSIGYCTCIPPVATCVSCETCFDFLSFRSNRPSSSPSSRLIYAARVDDDAFGYKSATKEKEEKKNTHGVRRWN